MRLDNLIEKFIHDLKTQKGYSDHTVRGYRTDLKHFLDFLVERQRKAGKEEDPPELESVNFLDIRGYLGALYDRYKRTTISRKLSSIRSFFHFLERRGLTSQNPAAEISTPKLGQYFPTYLPVDEMFRLLEGPDRENHSV